jgi:hypothetical protein
MPPKPRGAWAISPMMGVPLDQVERFGQFGLSPDQRRERERERRQRIADWQGQLNGMIRERDRLLADIKRAREWRDTTRSVAVSAKDPIVKAESASEAAKAELDLARLEANVPEHDRSIAWVKTQKPA